MSPRVIGIAGSFASGKDTLAHHLVANRNFMHVSTGDMVRVVAEAKYGSVERPVLQRTANELRQERGAGVLVQMAVEAFKERTKEYDGLAISGIRSVGEAESIKKYGTLVFVDAPVELRYDRIKDRGRAHEENLTLEEFKNSEEQEMHAAQGDESHQNVAAVRTMSDIIVQNDTSFDDFYARADKLLFPQV